MKLLKLCIVLSLCLVMLMGYANPSSHILVQNWYFPNPGKEKKVYELRLKASQIIANLGVPKGRVLKRINLSDRPYVMWECDYPSAEAQEKAVNIIKQSPEFKKVTDKMRTLVNHFERVSWEITE